MNLKMGQALNIFDFSLLELRLHMKNFSLFGINSQTLEAFKRQQRYFPYRYALARKYLPKFVNDYQKQFGIKPIDFAILSTDERLSLGTLQIDFFKHFTELVCKTPGNTSYANYLKQSFNSATNEVKNLDYLSKDIDDTYLPVLNTWKANILHELKLTLAFVNFYNSGKNIFDFPEYLLNSFKNTNIENIPLRDVKLPYPSFYLHFGLQKDFDLKLGHVVNSEFLYSLSTKSKPIHKYYLEGVYVKEIANGGFELALVASPESLVLTDNWIEYPTEAVFVKFPLIHLNTTIGEALGWEIIDTSAFQKKATFNYLEDNALLDRIDIDYNMQLLKDFLFYEFEEICDNKYRELVLEILKLVINAIFYIIDYRLTEEIVETIPGSVPNSLRKELESGDIDIKRKAFSKCERQGYSLVKMCGKRSCRVGIFSSDEIGKVDNFQQEQQQVESYTDSKRLFSSYHRKRHYRLCYVGKGRSEEALIWVEYAYVQGTLPLKEGLRIHEFSQPATSRTNVDRCDKIILNNKQIMEIRNMFGLGVANMNEIANFYKLPSEIIERIITKRQHINIEDHNS